MLHVLRNPLAAALSLALPMTAIGASPALSQSARGPTRAEVRAHPGEKRVLVCKDVAREANKGAVIGGVAGGVLGNVVAGHGSKTTGTVIGAGAGALAGHQIAKKRAKKNRECHYEWRPR